MNQTPVIIPGCGEGDVFLRSRRTKMHFKTKMMKLLLVVSAIVAVPVLGCAVVRYLLHPLAILAGALFCTFLYAIWRYHLEKKVFLLIFPLMFVLQYVVWRCLAVDGAGWDMAVIVRNAKLLAEGGNVEEYFAQYTNNIAVLCVFAGIFRMTRVLFGCMPDSSLAVLNIVLVNSSILFNVCTTRRLSDARTGWFVGVVMLFFAPFYLFIPIFYTDTLALFFVSLGLLFALWLSEVWQRRTNGWLKKSALAVLGGVLFSVGFVAKGIPAIVMIAMSVLMFFKLSLRRFFIVMILVFAGFFAGVWGWESAVVKIGGITQDALDRCRFPLTHFVMMGLKGIGAYDEPDVLYTRSFPTYAEKKAATEKEIVKRIRSFGLVGLVRHALHKVGFTWTSETCGPEAYLAFNAGVPVARVGLRALVLDGGRPDGGDLWRRRIVRAFCRGEAIFVSLFALGYFLAVLKGWIKELNGLVISLSFVGGVLFLVLWETHPRYTFSLMPTLLIMSALMFTNIMRRIEGGAERERTRLKRAMDVHVDNLDNRAEPVPVIIPVFGREDVFGTIALLRSQTYAANLRFIVIDNGNGPELSARLAALAGDDCRVVRFDENRGGSAAYIAGMDFARKNYPESNYVWLLDDDARPNPRTLPVLVETMDRLLRTGEKVASVGSTMVDKADPDRIIECGAAFVLLLGQVFAHLRGRRLHRVGSRTLRVGYAAAFSLLVNVQAVEACGFWEDVFIHLDDIEWGLRVSKAGWRNYATTASTVVHPKGGPNKAGAWVCYYDSRNLLWLAAKYGPVYVLAAKARDFLKNLRGWLMGHRRERIPYRKLAHADFKAGIRRTRAEVISAVEGTSASGSE